MVKPKQNAIDIMKLDFFKNLTMEQYGDIVKNGFNKTLKPGRILFHQGGPAKRCYLVKTGHLKLTKLTENGNEMIIRYVHAGELTAAVSVMNEKAYPLTAEAIEETAVVGWDKKTIIKIMRSIPDLAINTLSIVLERLDNIQNRYTELCTERVEQRVARTLLRLSKTSGLKSAQGICINIPLSRQDIANYTGTTIFTVSRVLSTWGKMGWIKSEREKITIVDAHSLETFAEKMK